MAFVLCLTLLPTSAFAAGEEYVAEADGTQYETLQDILDIGDEVEITLLDDVTEDLTVSAATTIVMDGHSITGNIEATADLTLTNGTVKGGVRVLGGTFTMTAPANADAAIDGDLDVKGGSCAISGANVGVKGTLYFSGDAMTIAGTDKAVEWTAPEGPAGKTLYGATTVDGDTTEEAKFEDGNYKVSGGIAKKLSDKQVEGSPASVKPTLTITPKTGSNAYNGQTLTFTVTYTGTDTLNAYVQGNTSDRYCTLEQTKNSDGTYTITVKLKETVYAGNYTLYVQEKDNSSVWTYAFFSVTAAAAKDDQGTYYTKIKDAIENAPDGSTITVIAAENLIQLPDDIYVENQTGITLDLNGHSLGGFPLNVGGLTALSKVRTGKLTVIDSSKGNGAVGVAVRNGGTLVFDPENDNTTLLQLDVYGGTVQLYGGKISRDGLRFENSVTLADLLPEEGGFAYYREGGAKLTIEQATSASCNLVVKSCDHNGTNGFDINSFTCPDCGAPAVAQTALKNVEGNPWRNFTNLQTALNSDRDGSSTLRLLADVSGDYTINGSVYTGLDLNGYSIKGNRPGCDHELSAVRVYHQGRHW